MRRRFSRPRTEMPFEFELDLAPLLAVMVKLVPVLLISSAFVQMAVIETDLPQAVKEAIQNTDTPPAQIQLVVGATGNLQIVVKENGQQKVFDIAGIANGQFDLDGLQKKILAVKQSYPGVFRLELAPDPKVSYHDLVKIMDEVRRVKDKTVRFPLKDKSTTDYMFPDIVFSNVMEG